MGHVQLLLDEMGLDEMGLDEMALNRCGQGHELAKNIWKKL